jgi:hypothetical protein
MRVLAYEKNDIGFYYTKLPFQDVQNVHPRAQTQGFLLLVLLKACSTAKY